MDVYDGFHVFYDEQNRLNAVEVFGDYKIALDMIRTYERLREPIPTSIRAIAGHQAFWEMFLLFVTEEIDEIEVQMYELIDVAEERKWQRQALRELKEKEVQK